MRTACIIPAFNEEKTIKDVIEVVKSVKIIDEVIVVSDGSKDNTAKISRDMGVFTIEYEENKGKGAALKAGIDNANADILLFLDADLIGLTKQHVISLLEPVINDEADMTIGIFSNGRLATDLAQKVAPHLSGQRAIKKEIITNINNIDMTRYGVEVALTKLVEKENYRVKTVELKDMTHIMKEEKLGFKKGIAARMKMYWEIVKCLKM
ncbi:glycosyltransferase family 2 protein [Caloramator sp. E03]|uniref:glycosyltransferase family 2 protein n=1 Tax=Caloramator sp. E03 TaxID=2576307 RepID=UPI001110C1E4|nr:glycosyltransferase family 2 protein [Caloramator sp. E03]QCX32274.1 glycosyltransferase family 2 protein [Caloramator sp. E03]